MTREDDVREDLDLQVTTLKQQLGNLQQQHENLVAASQAAAAASQAAAAEQRAQIDLLIEQLHQQQRQAANAAQTDQTFQRALNSVPHFDGKGATLFRDHMTDFESWRQARQILQDDQSKIALSYSLRSGAQTRIRGLLPGTDAFAKARTYKEYATLIGEIFAPAVEKGLSRSEFHAYNQQATEDVGSYVAIKMSLYDIAYEENEKSFQTLRGAMIKGLYSPVIKRTVSRRDVSNPEELRTAIFSAVASEREAYAGGWAESTTLDGLKSVTITHQRRGITEEGSVPMEIDSLYPRKTGPGPSTPGNSKKATETRSCHRCHRTGHLKKDCHARTTKDGKKLGPSEPKRPGTGEKNKKGCFSCGAHGHRQAECPKRRGRINEIGGEEWTEDDLTAEELHEMHGPEHFLAAGPSCRRRM